MQEKASTDKFIKGLVEDGKGQEIDVEFLREQFFLDKKKQKKRGVYPPLLFLKTEKPPLYQNRAPTKNNAHGFIQNIIKSLSFSCSAATWHF